MTSLGSKFISEDPDSRGQTGPASTVPGPEGPVSTVPGPAGEDGTGIVDAVVAGTNITVDNTDPANPIINSSASGGENTTKGDLEGYDTGAARIPVGANDEVLTADSAAALGVKWAAPAAGGGTPTASLANFKTTQSAQAFSGSLFASKGVSFNCLSNVNISHVSAFTDNVTAATYKLVIAVVSGATDVIQSILATSNTTPAAATALPTEHTFVFSSPVSLTSGTSYAFIFVRTDATSTTANVIAFPAGEPSGTDALEYRASVRYASNDPQVSDAVRFDTSTAAQCNIFYEVTTPATLATTINIATFVAGTPTNAEKLATYVAVTAFTLPVALGNSRAFAEVVATANATIDVKVNGVSKGSIDFALGASTATFTFASAVNITAGDRIQLVSQGTADATLADISLTIRGNI